MEERQIIVNAGAVILKEDNIVLVQEAKDPFTGKWNFPLGQVENGERIKDTLIREAKEETGYDIELTNFLGVYQSLAIPDKNVIILMFKAKVISGQPDFDKEELLRSKCFTIDEFSELKDEELFHPEMRNVVDRAFDNPRRLDNYIEF